MNFIKIGVVTLLAVLVASAPAAFASCTDASIKGTYGIVSTGLNGSSQPASGVDQITVDGAGNLSGTATKSIDGTIVTYSISGTYAIQTNCTGTAVFNNQNNNIEHDTFYLDNAGAGGLYNGAFLIQTDSSHVQTAIAVAQGAAICTDLGVKHAYSFEAAGLINGVGQIGAAARLTLNGTGSITGTETVSVNGAIHSSVAITGTYQINSDCTGTATLIGKGLSNVNLSLVVVNAGKEIMAVETDTNTIVTGTFQE